MTTVSILGGGAWGTALALTALKAGNQTTFWSRDSQQADEMKRVRENKKYLPGISLPTALNITASLEEAINSNIILLACPAQQLRPFLKTLHPLLSPESYMIVCSKGIEVATGQLMSEVMTEIFPHHCHATLSGPTFAQEVAEDKPTAAALACQEITTARWLASSLSSPFFRIYPTNDRTGVEIAGALKNVIAIAAGIATVRGLGESARASLITRGIAEMSRLGLAMGASLETFLGLSGIGDAVLTCTSELSRNMSFGASIGCLEKVTALDLKTAVLTEGVFTVQAVLTLAEKFNVDMPISKSIFRIIYEGRSLDEEIQSLLTRPLKQE